jgi:hypothetical protein
VLHYDGQNWKRLHTGSTGELWWISIVPIDGAFYLAGSNGKVLRHTLVSGVFERLITPGSETVFGVWGTTGENLWAVGGDLDNENTGGFVWRFDGTQWSVIDLSTIVPGGLPTLYKVWGRSADDVYVVGRLGLILHFDGSTWSRANTDTTRTLFTVNGDASQVIAVGGFGDAVIEELAGGSFVNRAPDGASQLNGIFFAPSGEPVAVGNAGTFARRTESGWQVQSTAFTTSWDFHATWVDAEGGVWAVGGNLASALNEGMLAYMGERTISTSVAQ